MDYLLRPEKFAVLHTDVNAKKEWLYWKKTFTNFLASVTASGRTLSIDKYALLVNHIHPDVYDLISDLKQDYNTVLTFLEELYVKAPNSMSARHILLNRKQDDRESLQTYLQELKKLSKPGMFALPTSSEQYENDYIRDVFILGLSSNVIRKGLLQEKDLTLQEVIEKAQIIESSQQDMSQLSNSNVEHDTSNEHTITSNDNVVHSNASLTHAINVDMPEQVSNYQSHVSDENTATTTVVKPCDDCGNNELPIIIKVEPTILPTTTTGHQIEEHEVLTESQLNDNVNENTQKSTWNLGECAAMSVKHNHLNQTVVEDKVDTVSEVMPELVMASQITEEGWAIKREELFKEQVEETPEDLNFTKVSDTIQHHNSCEAPDVIRVQEVLKQVEQTKENGPQMNGDTNQYVIHVNNSCGAPYATSIQDPCTTRKGVIIIYKGRGYQAEHLNFDGIVSTLGLSKTNCTVCLVMDYWDSDRMCNIAVQAYDDLSLNGLKNLPPARCGPINVHTKFRRKRKQSAIDYEETSIRTVSLRTEEHNNSHNNNIVAAERRIQTSTVIDNCQTMFNANEVVTNLRTPVASVDPENIWPQSKENGDYINL